MKKELDMNDLTDRQREALESLKEELDDFKEFYKREVSKFSKKYLKFVKKNKNESGVIDVLIFRYVLTSPFKFDPTSFLASSRPVGKGLYLYEGDYSDLIENQ